MQNKVNCALGFPCKLSQHS